MATVFYVVVAVGIYYAYEQYQLHKMVESLHEMNYVNKDGLTRMTIASYPAMDAYTARDKAIIADALQALSTLEVKDTRDFEESEAYYKITFADDTNFQMIVYTFYQNSYVKREEHNSVAGKTQYYKTEDPLFEDKFYPLLEAEM